MTDRIDKALALACGLQRMTLHGPPPLATTMEIAAGLVEAGGEIERLTLESKESTRLLKNAEWMLGVVTAERDEALADMEQGQSVTDEVVNAFGDKPRESGLWPEGMTVGEAVAALVERLDNAKHAAWERSEQ